MVRSAQSQAACIDLRASSAARSTRPTRLSRRIGTQLQKRLQNGHFLHVRKELCGHAMRSLTTLSAPPRRRGIAAPDADSRHEKKFAQIFPERALSPPRESESRESASTDSRTPSRHRLRKAPSRVGTADRTQPILVPDSKLRSRFSPIDRAKRRHRGTTMIRYRRLAPLIRSRASPSGDR
jgi:hypothetical protein